jgi:hypothetical protein
MDLPEGGTMPRTPTEIVETLWQRLWIDGNLESLDELIGDPYVRHTRDGTVTMTPAEYGEVIGAAVEVIRGTRVEVDEIAAAPAADGTGDMVSARMTLRAVNIAVGDEVTITWLAHYRIVGGRITESWVLHETGLDWSRD